MVKAKTINWRKRYSPLRPGNKVRVIRVYNGDWDEVDWYEGQILKLVRKGAYDSEDGQEWFVEDSEGDSMDSIFESEFERVWP